MREYWLQGIFSLRVKFISSSSGEGYIFLLLLLPPTSSLPSSSLLLPPTPPHASKGPEARRRLRRVKWRWRTGVVLAW